VENPCDLAALCGVIRLRRGFQLPRIQLPALERVDGEVFDAHLHLAARVLDVAEPVVVALGVVGLLDVWDVPDLFAADGVGTEF